MELKAYQTRALDAVNEYLAILDERRSTAAKMREIDPEMEVDFAEQAWKKFGTGRTYHPRTDGIGNPLPAFSLKIPTGGGKTLLATRAIDAVNTKYRKRQSGLVLWIVPTNAIYRQTFEALKNRDHPYRQFLDVASGQRTLVLEKGDRFSPADVAENLCVLMLMLPSANRVTKEQLRMFRDSAGFDRFFPGDEETERHAELLRRVPNLDTFGESGGGFWKHQIKTSLGNTLRILNPLIILDEGQKAYSANAKKTLEGFNPCLIVELSATPPATSNVLVDVKGRDLLDEDMVKLDLHIQNRSGTNWKNTLLASIEHRAFLEEKAREHEANTNEYIRPICLIQVERVGKDQRGPRYIHADDAREYLLQQGIPADWIAVKTSEKDDLKEIDDAGGLLERDCPVRFIITKQALQEGWDCSFAYILTILTNPGSKTALTQLVGRILRQPYARKTGIAALDESYVFCFSRKGRDLLEEIRKGFGLEGLGDLRGNVVEGGDRVEYAEKKEIKPREQYRNTVRRMVLPAFCIEDRPKEWRLVHYEADILSRVPWEEIDVSPLFDLSLDRGGDGGSKAMRTGLDERVLSEDPEYAAVPLHAQAARELDHSYVAAHLLDVLPNPWRGYELSQAVFDKLLERYGRETVTANFVFIVEELHKRIEAEKDRLAERTFRELLERGTMRFMVVMRDLSEFGIHTRLPDKKTIVEGERKATRLDGNQYMLSLFDHEPEKAMNELEIEVASYLDEQEELFFWYRNPVKRGYAVQGWKRQRIFADFIVTLAAENADAEDPYRSVFLLETKGLHLTGNPDTGYKRSVFSVCNEQAEKTNWAELVDTMRDKKITFEVVDEDEWRSRLNEIIAAA